MTWRPVKIPERSCPAIADVSEFLESLFQGNQGQHVRNERKSDFRGPESSPIASCLVPKPSVDASTCETGQALHSGLLSGTWKMKSSLIVTPSRGPLRRTVSRQNSTALPPIGSAMEVIRTKASRTVRPSRDPLVACSWRTTDKNKRRIAGNWFILAVPLVERPSFQ